MKMRMVRVPRGLFWLFVCTVAFCIMFSVSHLHQPSLWVWSDTPYSDSEDFGIVATSDISNDTSQNFTCSASDSKEIIPPNLSKSFQEFLRYRHCRSFPTLLTPSPCEDDLYLLLAIKSTAVNKDRRAALRDTWGRAGLVKGRRVKIVFLMGRSPDPQSNHQSLLEWENRRYGDILQWNFADIFYNLPWKEIHFLSWFSSMCRSAQFALKGDDDVFAITENLVEYLEAHSPENHLFTGYIHPPTAPLRNTDSKYFIPVNMYPKSLYPPFPSGGGYLMSRQTVFGLDVVAQKVDLFPLDDVFLGMCLQQMGITLTHHKGFRTFGLSLFERHLGPCVYRDIMLMHTLNPAEMRIMWARIHDKRLRC